MCYRYNVCVDSILFILFYFKRGGFFLSLSVCKWCGPIWKPFFQTCIPTQQITILLFNMSPVPRSISYIQALDVLLIIYIASLMLHRLTLYLCSCFCVPGVTSWSQTKARAREPRPQIWACNVKIRTYRAVNWHSLIKAGLPFSNPLTQQIAGGFLFCWVFLKKKIKISLRWEVWRKGTSVMAEGHWVLLAL